MALIDDMTTTINASLVQNLDWLDNAFGVVSTFSRKSRTDDRVKVYYPAVFIGGNTNRFTEVFPDSKLGNFSYCEVINVPEYEKTGPATVRPIFRLKIVFWFKWPSLYPADWKARSIEEIKGQVFAVLLKTQYTRTVERFKTYEKANDIYKGFDHRDIEEQFLMRPYGGFAVEVDVYGPANCQVSTVVPTIPLNLFALLPFNHQDTVQIWPIETYNGATIWTRTWNLGAGTGALANLTGLAVSGFGKQIRGEIRGNIAGKPYFAPVELFNNAGTFAVYSPAGVSDIQVTLYWTNA